MRQGSGGPLLEAWVGLATGLAILPSIWLWGLLVRRRGLRVVVRRRLPGEIVGVVASVLVPGMAGPLIAGVLLGGTFVAVTCLSAFRPVRKLAAQAPPPAALALMTASFGTGQILGPSAADSSPTGRATSCWPRLLARCRTAVVGLAGPVLTPRRGSDLIPGYSAVRRTGGDRIVGQRLAGN